MSAIGAETALSGRDTPEDVSVYYELTKALQLVSARKLLRALPEDSIHNWVSGTRARDGAPPILGAYVLQDKGVLVEP